jgi:predicted nucleic acid-binding protein
LILIDAGPLAALVDSRDQHHDVCVAALQGIREPLATVWPALTEAMYLLADLPLAQQSIWQMLLRGSVRLLPLDAADVPRIQELMRKYADRRMDMADAALIRAAEREGVRTFFTVDRKDFQVYRLHGRARPIILP